MELTKCVCCGGSVSPKANACPLCGNPMRKPSELAHARFAWGVVFFLSVLSLAGVFAASLLFSGMSAPQQCAAIAGCIGLTVIPYCYARAVEKF